MHQQPSVGRVVHYVMLDGKVRPGLVVQVWTDGLVNMQVFTDGCNDDTNLYLHERSGRDGGKGARNVVWRTSVRYDEAATPEPGTWHWPPRV